MEIMTVLANSNQRLRLKEIKRLSSKGINFHRIVNQLLPIIINISHSCVYSWTANLIICYQQIIWYAKQDKLTHLLSNYYQFHKVLFNIVLFTHHSTFPSNILNKYITIILHPSKLLNWKHLSKLVFKLKFFLAMELKISTQNLALPSQKRYKVIYTSNMKLDIFIFIIFSGNMLCSFLHAFSHTCTQT